MQIHVLALVLRMPLVKVYLLNILAFCSERQAYQIALGNAIDNLFYQIEHMNRAIRGPLTTSAPDLVDEVLEGTEELRRCNSGIDKLLTRSWEPSEMPNPRGEARRLYKDHREKIRRFTEIV